MKQPQLDLILTERFPRLSENVKAAVRDVLLTGASSYEAENKRNCARGTVSRYVKRVQAEFDFCEEVMRQTEQEIRILERDLTIAVNRLHEMGQVRIGDEWRVRSED